MPTLIWINEEKIEKMQAFLPKDRGKPRVDDRRALSRIVWVLKSGCRWKDAPWEYRPYIVHSTEMAL
jgi:transposase